MRYYECGPSRLIVRCSRGMYWQSQSLFYAGHCAFTNPRKNELRANKSSYINCKHCILGWIVPSWQGAENETNASFRQMPHQILMQYTLFMKILTDCIDMTVLNEMLRIDLVQGACIIINAVLNGGICIITSSTKHTSGWFKQ